MSVDSHQFSLVRLLLIKKESGSRTECYLSTKHSWKKKKKKEKLKFFQEDENMLYPKETLELV